MISSVKLIACLGILLVVAVLGELAWHEREIMFEFFRI